MLLTSCRHLLTAKTGKNSQSHLGVIVSSNLCTEIVQYSSPTETAVCTLASVALPKFVLPGRSFDFDSFHSTVKLAVHNTDRLIDVGNYPTELSRTSAIRTRAIGVGVQGLADTFMALGIPYDAPDARNLNVEIFEALYHAALEASIEEAESVGPYPAFAGSPTSTGMLYIDMWSTVPRRRYEFDDLRLRATRSGVRNSLMVAQMPTASTALIMGNSEGVEPYSR